MVKKSALCMAVFLMILTVKSGYSWDGSEPLIIDHTCTDLAGIPNEWIDSVKANVRMHYMHTSHGAQLTAGLLRIEDADPNYGVAIGQGYLPTEAGAFCIYDTLGGAEDYWYGRGIDTTRQILTNNPGINVSMLSWCIELNQETEAYVDSYLDSISRLEAEFPDVRFVYMTGNAQKNGAEGCNRFLRNEQIREHCVSNNKVLFDFSDLDSWWFNPASHEWEHKTYEYETHTIPWQHFEFAGDDSGHVNWESCEQKGKAVWWMTAQLAGCCAQEPKTFVRADVDEDSTVTMGDAVYTLRYLYVPGGERPRCMKTADADDDGIIVMADAIYTLRYLYVPGGPQPPQPFPDCGSDPTADGLGCTVSPCVPVEITQRLTRTDYVR